MNKFFSIFVVVLAHSVATSTQGLQDSTYRKARFVTSPNIRATASIWRPLTVPRDTLCASACMADNYCVAYNVRQTGSPAGVLACELLNDVINTTSEVNSAFSIIEVITQSTDPDYVPLPNAAFSAFINTMQSAQSVVSFTNVPVNIGGVFDTVTNNFVVPRNGLYWQHIHSYSDVNTMCDYSLISTAGIPRIGVFRNFTAAVSTYDVLSRDDLRWLPSRAQIYVTSLNTIGSAGAAYVRASWSAFKLDEFMSPLVAFNVYQDSTTTTPSSPTEPVPFNNVVVNEGGGWNVTSYTFVSPVSGIYVFSFGVAGSTGQSSLFTLMTSTGEDYDAVYANSATTGIHISHRTVITYLPQGQSAWVTGFGSVSFGDIYQLSSFKGFLYSPPQGFKVIWFARPPSSGSAPTGDLTLTPLFNIGNVWQSSNALIPASAPGVYYISYGAMQSSGASGVNAALYINGVLTSLTGIGPNAAFSLYREAAHMASLTAGTTVSMRISMGGYTSSGTGMCGFLLYPQ